jgi:hypothetical protein
MIVSSVKRRSDQSISMIVTERMRLTKWPAGRGSEDSSNRLTILIRLDFLSYSLLGKHAACSQFS